MHLIEPDPIMGFIEVTVSGFWNEAHFDSFVVDLRAAIAASPPGAPPMTLYNYTHAAIQTQSIVARMRALALHPMMLDRKVALYTEGVLARQQAKRVAGGRDNMRVFDSRDDAIAYLTGTDAVASVSLPTTGLRNSHTRLPGSGTPRSISQIKADPPPSSKLA